MARVNRELIKKITLYSFKLNLERNKYNYGTNTKELMKK